MGPDRDLIHPDESIRTNGMDYVRHCIDAAQTLGAANVVGPLYSAVGRTWQADADERKQDLDLLVRQLRELATYAGRSRRHDSASSRSTGSRPASSTWRRRRSRSSTASTIRPAACCSTRST